ncbi:zinc-binding dehydrogenase [Paenibacillus validus]|uniref:zinc-binding dehydrogenase n=1 Tax=Paenibacillus validus TaxID=44253 RepID=UPI000FD8EFF9|nr:zinc-binding dehydrogenase [Paenibacillus validus]MED4601904.1 zinc-binding dehydrogenase [Paenibacillus validus]MED4606414.1 zinc-binding dehydrogenase [Paenibacillus validus]
MKGKIVYQTEPMKIEVREHEFSEEVEAGSVLLEVLQTNVCGSELHVFKGHHPTLKCGVIGHEMIGRIAKLGDNVKTDNAGNPVQVGDRVVPVYFVTCNQCRECLAGNLHHCIHMYKYQGQSGTFASYYMVHHDQYFFKVPDGVSNAEAASANCAFAQILFGLDKIHINPGDSIVIQGAGGLGLTACAVAKERGAKVIVIDSAPSRLVTAKKFGADELIDMNAYDTLDARVNRVKELTGGWGADFGLEVAGVPDAFSEGIHLVKQNGKYVVMGNITPGHTTAFDPGLLVRKAIEIIPANRYNPEYLYKSLQFLERNAGKYPFAGLLDAAFSLEEATLALEKSANREVTRATILVNK